MEEEIAKLKLAVEALSKRRSSWSFDTRAALAASIVGLMISSIAMLVMLSLLNVKVDPTIFAVLTTLLGVLASNFKDVYGFWYGSSSTSKDKDDTISQMATNAAATDTGNRAVAPLQPLVAPLATTTGEEVTSVSGTTTEKKG